MRRHLPRWGRPAVRWLVLAGLVAPRLAFGNNAVQAALDHPSQLAINAQSGLFTSVASAGTRLVAVGERGRILLSDNNGHSWRQVETPTSVTLTNVHFASPEQGWAVGQMGIVLHTIDGGQTWLKELDGLQANKLILAAAKADIVAQGANDADTANLQAAQQFVAGGPSVPFLNVLPLSARHLYLAGGYGMAFESDDAGASWRTIFDHIPNPNGLHIYALVQNGAAIFLIGEQGFLVSDQAAKFTPVVTPNQGSFFGGMSLPDGTLLLFGLQGTVLRSNDQGKTWTQSATNVSTGIDCGLVMRSGKLLLGDVSGDLLLSADGGKSFDVSKNNQPVVALAETADQNLIIAGPNGLQRIAAATLK